MENLSPSIPSPIARWLARLSIRHPWKVLAAGLLVCGVAILLASKLSLQTDLSELLPAGSRSVVMLKQVNKRIGGNGNVAIALEPLDGKPDALRAYIPHLADALRKSLGKDLLSIKYERKEVSAFYHRFGAWYVPLADLERWTDRLSEAVARRANPMLVDLDDEPSGDSDVKKLVDEVRADRARQEPPNVADEETGIFIRKDEHGYIGVLFVRPAANALNLAGSSGMLARIQQVVDSTHPEQHGVRLARPGYTGSIPTALTEYEAVQRDILGTAVLVCLMVGLVVVLYFRGVRELLLMSGALVIGAACAMGFAWLWIRHVNGQTAFLGSIIVGTGINYGIILLDRYRLARRRGAAWDAALETAIDESLRATWIAALGTAVSFGVLAAGEVESFHQFGWVGGVGILSCWLATYTFVPACLVLADRRRGPEAIARPHRRRLLERLLPVEPLPWLFRGVGRATARAPLAFLVGTLALVAASAVVAYRARHDCVETDMHQLGTKSTDTTGIHKLDGRLRPMDDRSSTPEVVAAGTREEAFAVCQRLLARAADPTDLQGIVTGCHTVFDVFPTEPARRQALFARLARDLEHVDEKDLAAPERAELADWKRALAEPPPGDDDLPLSLKEYFIERDGSLGKLAFVDPHGEEHEDRLYKFSDAIRRVELPSGTVIETSGFTVVFADVLRAMRRDAKKLTLWAAVLVYVVLALVTRRLGVFLRVGGALLAGVVLMLGGAVLLGHKLNFFNFVALPTTFGIGIDYGINIEERLRGKGRAALASALAEGAPAVALASLTSIFGYVSLLTADSRALSSFGSLAIIGEVTTLAAAITLIPALLALHSAPATAAPDASQSIGSRPGGPPASDDPPAAASPAAGASPPSTPSTTIDRAAI